MTLADFTAPSLIATPLPGSDSSGAIRHLTELLAREGRVEAPLQFERAVLDREKLSSTNMGSGIALPHGRAKSVPKLSFGLGRPNPPLAWGDGKAQAVRLIFLLAIPEQEGLAYLSLISGLVRLTKQPVLLAGLLAASSKQAILKALAEVEVRAERRPAPPVQRA